MLYVYVSTRFGVCYASVTRHNTLQTVLKRAYFMTGLAVFCVQRACDRRETLSIVTLDWSEFMGGYNTPDTVARDRKTK